MKESIHSNGETFCAAEEIRIQTVSDLKAGDHLCQIYRTEREHKNFINEYLISGLLQNEKVLYIIDIHTKETILGYLKEKNFDPSPYLSSGQLAFFTHKESYTKEGDFDPDRMIKLLDSETNKAINEGYPALRVTGEMTWSQKGIKGSEKLLEYEAKLNNFFPDSKALAICQYDKRKFPPDILMGVLNTHPIAVIGTEIITNPFYIPTASFLNNERSQATLDGWLTNLLDGKRLQDKLQKSADDWEKTFDSISDLIFIQDNHFNIIKSNKSFADALKMNPEDLVGKKCYNLLHGANKPWEKCPFKETLRDRKAHTEEVLDPNIGVPLLVTTSPFFDKNGKLKGSVHVAKDITEIKDEQDRFTKLNALQSSLVNGESLDKKLTIITDAVVDIFKADFARIWLVAPGDRCSGSCPHASVTSGQHVCRARDKCLHMKASSGRYTHTDEGIHARVPFGCYKIGGIASGEYPSFLTNDVVNDPRIHNHDWARELELVSFAGVQLHHPKYNTMGVLALFSKKYFSEIEYKFLINISNVVVRVICSTMEHETLKESENKYKTLIETIPQKIFIKDKNSTFISCNKKYATDLGISPEEITGKTDFLFFPKDLADKYREDDKMIMDSGKTVGFEEKYIEKGKDKWIYTVKTPFKDSIGNTTGVLGVFSDITDLKENQCKIQILERKLYQSQKMEQIGAIASSVSHDFNNILASISGFAELFLCEHKEKDSKRKYVEGVLSAANKGKEIAKNILSYSKPKEDSFEPLDIVTIVDDALKILEASLKHIAKITVTVIPRQRRPILGDSSQLMQMMINLILNARDAMSGKWGYLDIIIDEISLMKDRLPLPDITPGKYMKMTIRDTGHGMSKEVQEQIFNSFFTTKGTEGTGLGLEIVHRVIKNHNGAISVQSQPDKGSSFDIFIPIIAEK
ncbi:MAG: hypothetical protein A2X47_04425 [Lentisphaerae bacterium GWF2_38_69]|nr:MAG: hypothetical protein A2X47_04425 [Lentisphaerae bacterium GWF2_38_69]